LKAFADLKETTGCNSTDAVIRIKKFQFVQLGIFI
jgi:hypothetical protein